MTPRSWQWRMLFTCSGKLTLFIAERQEVMIETNFCFLNITFSSYVVMLCVCVECVITDAGSSHKH